VPFIGLSIYLGEDIMEVIPSYGDASDVGEEGVPINRHHSIL